jgi:hypothetical protein
MSNVCNALYNAYITTYKYYQYLLLIIILLPYEHFEKQINCLGSSCNSHDYKFTIGI